MVRQRRIVGVGELLDRVAVGPFRSATSMSGTNCCEHPIRQPRPGRGSATALHAPRAPDRTRRRHLHTVTPCGRTDGEAPASFAQSGRHHTPPALVGQPRTTKCRQLHSRPDVAEVSCLPFRPAHEGQAGDLGRWRWMGPAAGGADAHHMTARLPRLPLRLRSEPALSLQKGLKASSGQGLAGM